MPETEPPVRHFCTYFDSNFLDRGLALYRSLERHGGRFVLWVLALDEAAYGQLAALGLPGLRPIRLADFERGDAALAAAKRGRSAVEYYFTCTPSLPLYILKHSPEIDAIAYVDADVFFYSSPEPLFSELGEGSILVIEHGFAEPFRHHNDLVGAYNVGVIVFRNDARGRECLQWWRERCNEWCYDKIEGGRFADQKYLEDWPRRFGAAVSRRKGAGLAPWNHAARRVELRDGAPTVEGEPLIFYHFSSLRMIRPWLYDLFLSEVFDSPPSLRLRRWVYGPYLRALADARREMASWEFQADSHRLRWKPYRLVSLVRSLLQGRLLVAVGRVVF